MLRIFRCAASFIFENTLETRRFDIPVQMFSALRLELMRSLGQMDPLKTVIVSPCPCQGWYLWVGECVGEGEKKCLSRISKLWSRESFAFVISNSPWLKIVKWKDIWKLWWEKLNEKKAKNKQFPVYTASKAFVIGIGCLIRKNPWVINGNIFQVFRKYPEFVKNPPPTP